MNGTVPRSNWSSFSNSRPSTTVVPGQGTGVSGVTAPAVSSAVAVIVFMLDPGGKRPAQRVAGVGGLVGGDGEDLPRARAGRRRGAWAASGRRRRRRRRSGSPARSASAAARRAPASTDVDLPALVGGVLVGADDRTVKPGVPVSCSWKARWRPERPELVAVGVRGDAVLAALLDDLGGGRARPGPAGRRRSGTMGASSRVSVGKTAPGRSKTWARIASKSGRAG